MNILSIQSWVAYGHVGNAAALFPLQRLGAEVWAVNTVQFSNHPGYGDFTGRAAPGTEIADILAGIERRGAFARCDAVLSGYLGDPSVAETILGAVAQIRRAAPACLYCCDPVIGDAGRVYVREPIPHMLAERFVPEADVLTPNQFELERLTGLPCGTVAETRRALAALQSRMRPAGPAVILLTSLVTDETPPGMLDVVAADRRAMHRVRIPTIEVAASGAGDATSALFLYHLLRTGDAAQAMPPAIAAINGVLRRTRADGARDLALIAAQDEIAHPSLRLVPSIF